MGRAPGRLLAASPDPQGGLSEGVGVEAHVLARLLGMPLLRVHADVVLVPVRLREAPPALVPAAEPRTARGTANWLVGLCRVGVGELELAGGSVAVRSTGRFGYAAGDDRRISTGSPCADEVGGWA